MCFSLGFLRGRYSRFIFQGPFLLYIPFFCALLACGMWRYLPEKNFSFLFFNFTLSFHFFFFFFLSYFLSFLFLTLLYFFAFSSVSRPGESTYVP